MATNDQVSPLIVIVGPTASGKTDLAVSLAEKFNGEIVCADSRTVYRGLDIGTAKPSVADRQRVKHHLLDVVDPTEVFNVSRFKQLADQAITEIKDRGKLPFLVGGSGLYIDAVIYNFSFRPAADPAQRAALNGLSVQELQDRLLARGLALPNNERNPRHLIRALEAPGLSGSQDELRANTLILGLEVSADDLEKRSKARAEQMIAEGLITEGKELFAEYDGALPALQAPAYRALKPYLEGTVDQQQLIRLIFEEDRRLAKKQRTWFKRNKSIHWLNDPRQAVDIMTTFLNKHP